MNTDCTTYRQTLRAQFDAGEPIGSDVADHTASCTACAAYRDELIALEDAFAAMPLETPRNALAHRVKSRLAEEPAHANDARWWLPTAAVLACVFAVSAAAYYSFPMDPGLWWDYAYSAGATTAWMYTEVSFADELSQLQLIWNEALRAFDWFSAPWMWVAAIVAATVLAGLNGAEAYRLRTASNRTIHYR